MNSAGPLLPRLSANTHNMHILLNKCLFPLINSLCIRSAEQSLFQESAPQVGGEGSQECKSMFQVDILLKQKLLGG